MRGLAAAAERLLGDGPADVCATLERWRRRHHRELARLTGPYFSAVGPLDVAPPRLVHARALERFLIGGETDPDVVREAIDQCLVAAGDDPAPLPPDARGSVLDAAERFFDLLEAAYRDLQPLVRDERRRDTEDAVARWQERLDGAADDVDDRVQLLAGLRVRDERPRVGRRSRDRPAAAAGFVVVALLVAGAVLWLVLHGWPMERVGTLGR